MALREYYSERRKATVSSEHQALEEIRGILSSSDGPNIAKVREIAQASARGVEDEWALKYISISRIQPLLEAFDDDASSLVSISEVNAFTKARPKNWRYVIRISSCDVDEY